MRSRPSRWVILRMISKAVPAPKRPLEIILPGREIATRDEKYPHQFGLRMPSLLRVEPLDRELIGDVIFVEVVDILNGLKT